MITTRLIMVLLGLLASFILLIFLNGLRGLIIGLHFLAFTVLAFIISAVVNGETFSLAVWFFLSTSFLVPLGISIFLRRKY